MRDQSTVKLSGIILRALNLNISLIYVTCIYNLVKLFEPVEPKIEDINMTSGISTKVYVQPSDRFLSLDIMRV